MNQEEIKKAILANVDVLAEALGKVLTPKHKSKFSVGSKVIFNAYKDGVDFNEYDKIWIVVSLEEAPQRIKCKQEGDFGGWHYSWPSEDELELYKETTFKPGDLVSLKFHNYPAIYTVKQEDDGLVTCELESNGRHYLRHFQVCNLKLVKKSCFAKGDWVCLKTHPDVALEVVSEENGIVTYKLAFNNESILAGVPADSLILWGLKVYNPGDIIYRICDIGKTIPLTVVSQSRNEVICNYTVFGQNHTKSFLTCNLTR